MTLLARKGYVGHAKESVAGTYLAAVRFNPATGIKAQDMVAPLRDESIKGNDDVLQGIYGGPAQSASSYSLPHLYPDVLGDLLRAMVGPDTITAGVSTTMSSSSSAGATTISVAASIASGKVIQIGSGVTTEWATTSGVSGSGPYTLTVPPLLYAHVSTSPVISQSTHVFAQDQRANPVPSYSLTVYNGVETRGYPGCALSDLDLKIDPKGAVSADAKWTGFPSAVQSTVAPTWNVVNPFLGWQWTLTLGGTASTRGLTGDYSLKRAVEAISSSDGTQGPREVFPGALESDFKLKAIFENDTDFTQFLGYTNVVLLSTLTQPASAGGQSLTITNTGTKYIDFDQAFDGIYLTADISASSAFNATDGGVGTVTLVNYVNTAY